jgi:hypothetical protein
MQHGLQLHYAERTMMQLLLSHCALRQTWLLLLLVMLLVMLLLQLLQIRLLQRMHLNKVRLLPYAAQDCYH